MKILKQIPSELKELKTPVEKLYYKGDISLLKKPKVAIVGSRRPISYTKNITYELAKKLSNTGICIVSGAAMGVDALAHQGAGSHNTTAVMGNGLNHRYPKVNKNLIEKIEQNGLVLSMFEPDFIATPWSFVVRNEIIVALSQAVVITQADLNSGSMRSAEFALKHNKSIYVLPHRLNESKGTNRLLKEGLATAIYDMDEFVKTFDMTSEKKEIKVDEFYEFCKSFPRYEDALKIFGDRVFEEELEGNIVVQNGTIRLA